ncbi:hypothetical protein [Helicobacter sp. L8]|uniref:hypothetical protein n=1 Tax=Helicobacter sp. L8 TaxID=2316078 RepID=UPI000EB355DF|nr:hypothetical protein [Helicobacter sp. L8]
MEQKVHNLNYLCKVVFNLDEDTKNLVAIPAGAEVLDVTLEISKVLTGASIDIGFTDETQYFLDDVSADNKGYHRSESFFSAPSTTQIQAAITGHNKTTPGQAILRVVYYLPSVISVEY